ncbi:MAG: hypothetical protein ABUS79_22385 [Pseudomonadota bacterium]
MIAVDTNILVYAHRRESPFHEAAAACVRGSGQIRGAKIHDARIAAIALAHGIRELLSADRDFSRMAPLSVRNTLRS